MRIAVGRRRSFTPRTASHRIALATLVLLTTTACSVSRWQPMPPTEASVHKEKLRERTVRLLMARGWVVLEVEKVDYPFLEGRARPGTGDVRFDVRRARSAATIATEGGSLVHRLQALGPDDLGTTDLAGRQVQFEAAEGPVALIVSKVDYPFVRGRPALCLTAKNTPVRCTGWVHIDLRDAQDFSIKKTDSGKTIGAWSLLLFGILDVLVIVAFMLSPPP